LRFLFLLVIRSNAMRARNVADPQRPHELEAGEPSQVLGVPFPQLRVLGILTDDGVLYDGVAEMIHHRRDGKDATNRSYRLFCMVCVAGAYAFLAPADIVSGAANARPATAVRLVIEVKTAFAMVTPLDGDG
jgi:hypothetical protein